MKMIVGLGNPGRKYDQTKHNMGFMTLDALAKKYGATFDKNEFEANYTIIRIDGERVYLVKPQTFMNDSGRAVRPLMSFYQIQLDELLVIQDDMDMDVGRIRLRHGGSAGGHNGIKSIISALGTQDFGRLKIGIAHPQRKKVVDYVLTPFDKESQPLIDGAIDNAVDACAAFIEGVTFANMMNQFNHK